MGTESDGDTEHEFQTTMNKREDLEFVSLDEPTRPHELCPTENHKASSADQDRFFANSHQLPRNSPSAIIHDGALSANWRDHLGMIAHFNSQIAKIVLFNPFQARATSRPSR